MKVRNFVRPGLKSAVSLLALSMAAGTAHAESQMFHIDAQSLDKALLTFHEQSGVTVAAPRDLVQGKSAPAVHGEMDPEEALEQILSGSGLASNRLQAGAYTIMTASLETEADETPAPFRTAQLIQEAESTPAEPVEVSDADELQLDVTVVTGVRGAPRTVTDSPIPIDVFSADELEQIPLTGGLFEQFRYLVPSLNLPQRAGGGTATFIASAGLRGLNPDQTLVLVNGKRRHKTSLINTSTGLYSGSAGVDLNMIPSSAIARVEVLRDGAAAQYGSDAIAGVINIILKDDAEGGSMAATRGANFDRGDGEFFSAGGSTGFALGQDGFLHVSLDYRTTEQSERASPVPIPTVPGEPFRFYPDVDNGDGTFSVDPRESIINRQVRNFGNYPTERLSGAYNLSYDFGEIDLYSFGTYTDRDSTLFFTFRRPRDGRNNPEIFPNGFIPEEEIREQDYEVVGGLRGVANDWNWDLSAGYGKNIADWYNNRGANASLGEFSPDSFYLGAFEVDELSANLDVTKAFDLGEQGDLQVSFGAQARTEEFSISEGDPEGSLTFDSPLIVQPNDPCGAQGFPAFGPDDVNSLSRDNFGIYGELGWQANEKLYLNGAARYENYSDDSGDQTIVKLTGRYDFTDWFGLRGSANTGFRAPSVQQLGFKGSRGQFVDLDNDSIAETIVLR